MSKRILTALFLFAALGFFAITSQGWIPDDADGDGVPDSVDACPAIDASFFDRDGDGCLDDPRGARHIEYWGWVDSVVTYVINDQGEPTVVDGSDFTAVQNAFGSWTSISGADLDAVYGGTTAQMIAGVDGVNLVTFIDNVTPISSLVLALGVATSFESDTLIAGRLYRAGEIYDADMIFNPSRFFTTPSSGGTGTDIEAVAAHEAGHVFGLSHSAVLTSSLFYVLQPGNGAASLTDEDRSIFLKAYPDDATLNSANRIDGIVTDGNTSDPVPGAIVFAIDAVSGDTVGCDYTLPDGSYTMFGIADGSYYIGIHALDGTSPVGFIQPGNINSLVEATAVTLIVPEYWDLAESATDDPTAQDPIAVSGGSGATADLITNVDNQPPNVVTTTPTDGTVNYPIDGALIIEFDEGIDSGTLSGNFALRDIVTGAGSAGSIAILRDDSVIAFTASPPLQYGTTYELTLDTGLADKFGNTLPVPYTMQYTTEPEPPINVTSVAPSKGVVGTTAVINGTGFDVSPPPTVTFAGGAAAVVDNATPLQLTVQVPFGASTGNVVVVNNSDAATDSINFTLLSSEEIARGFESGQTLLPAAPNAIAVTPSGDWAYVGHASGITAMVVNPALPGYLNPVEISYDGDGINGIAGLPDGRRMYGVDPVEMEFVEINSNVADPPGVFNEVLNTEAMDAEPIDIDVDPFGYKAYITTRESEIQVWDVKLGSMTFRQQVGVLHAPTTLQGRVLVSPDGAQAYALTDLGDMLFYDLGPDTLATSLAVGLDPRDIALDPVGQRAYVTHGNGDITIVSLGGATAAPFVVTDISTGGSLRGHGITPAGSYLYATDREQDKMKIVDLVEASATWRTVISDFPLDINPVRVELSPDGVYAFSLLQGGGASQPRMLVTTIGLGPELKALTPRAGVPDAVVTLAGEGFGTFQGFSGSVIFNGATNIPQIPAWTGTAWGTQVPAGAMTGPVKTRQIIDIPPHDIEESNEIYFEVLGGTDPAAAIRVVNSVSISGIGGPTGSMALSADGRAAYLAGRDATSGTVIVVDTDPTSATFETLINTFAVTTQWVNDVAVTADGKIGFAVDASAQEISTFWAARTHPLFGQSSPALDLNGFFLSVPVMVATSPDNQYVAVWDDVGDGAGEILIIDAAGAGDGVAPVVVDLVSVGEGVTDMMFDPYGHNLVVVQRTPNRVFSVTRGSWTVSDIELFPTVGTMRPTSMDFTRDMDKLYIRAADVVSGARVVLEYKPGNPMQFTQSDTLAYVNTWGHGSSGQPATVPDIMRVSPHNDRAVISFQGAGIGFWEIPDLSDGLVNTAGVGGTNSVHDMAFSLTGDRLYMVNTETDELEVYDFEGSANLLASGGDNQTGVINEVLSGPLRVTVVDPATSSPIPGAQVTFRVKTGGGGVGFGSSFGEWVVSITNITGQAQTQWKLGPVIGEQTVECSVNLIGYSSPSPLTFVATGTGVPASVPLTFNAVAPSGVNDVGVNTPTLVTFNRGVDRSTVSGSSLYLRENGQTAAIPAAFGYTQDDARVSLTPVSSLNNGTTYEVIVTAALQDTSGNNLTNPPAPGSESFSTVAAGPPDLFSVSPPGGVITTDVVLSGVNFDPTPSNNTVLFNDLAATPSSGNTGQLIVAVPKLAVSGEVSVVVGPDTTDALDFNVLTPSSTTIDDVIATVGTGQGLRGVAVGPDGVAYCVSPDGDVVIPVSPDSLASLPSINVGDQPVAIAIDPLAKLAYVCNFNSNTASVIDVDQSSPTYNTVVATVLVGSNPVDVAIFPGLVFIANAGSSNISVIDSDPASSNQNAVLATIGTGNQGARGVAVGPDGGRLYVGTDNGFVVIDLSTNAVIASAGVGTGARGVAVGPDGALLYLLGADGDLYVIDIEEGSATENAVIATIGTGNARGVAVGPDGGTIYLIQDDSDEVLVIAVNVILGVSVQDAASPSFIFEWEIINVIQTGSEPAAIAFDPRGQGLFYIAVAGEQEGLEVRGTGLGDLKVVGEVHPQTLNLQSKGRWVSAWMEFPPPYHPNQVDLSTVLLNDTVPAVPDKFAIRDDDKNGVDELHVKFDRGDFQLAVPHGDSVPVWVSGELPARSFTMCDTIRTIRPTIIKPKLAEYVPIGQPYAITWNSPSGKTVDYVDVEWSSDDGETWNPVATGVPDVGVAMWDVPGIYSEFARVAVTLYHKDEPIGIGMSDRFFMTVPVAIRLTSFNIRVHEGAAVLSWQTATEVNVDSYRLLRSTEREGVYTYVDNGTVDAADDLGGAAYEFRDETINANQTYFYKLEEVTSDGGPGGVYGPYQIAMRLVFGLEQNHPNPFNPTTTIKFAIPEAAQVRLEIYDVAGRRVTTLVNEHRRANFYTVEWNGMNNRGNQVASGVYFYRLTAGHHVQTKKMVMLK